MKRIVLAVLCATFCLPAVAADDPRQPSTPVCLFGCRKERIMLEQLAQQKITNDLLRQGLMAQSRDRILIQPNPNAIIPDISNVRPNPNAVIPDISNVRPNPNAVIPDIGNVKPNPNATIPNLFAVPPDKPPGTTSKGRLFYKSDGVVATTKVRIERK